MFYSNKVTRSVALYSDLIHTQPNL